MIQIPMLRTHNYKQGTRDIVKVGKGSGNNNNDRYKGKKSPIDRRAAGEEKGPKHG
jgi:hypothetical protein